MSTPMRILILTLLLAATCAAFAVETDVEKAEKAWSAAVTGRNFAALDKIYANELLYAHSTGNVENKQQYMDRLKSGKQRYEKVDFEKIKVLPHGDTAVVHGILRMAGTSNGEPFNHHIMLMHVWVKKGSEWKLVAHQTTRIAD